MDKETAVEIQKLKGDVETLKEAHKAWNTLIKDTIIKIVSWLVAIGTAGALYGWHLPENVRKSLSEWISK